MQQSQLRSLQALRKTLTVGDVVDAWKVVRVADSFFGLTKNRLLKLSAPHLGKQELQAQLPIEISREDSVK
jgi:hypothetical protein